MISKMKKFLILLTLFSLDSQILAGISIYKGTDVGGFSFGKPGVSVGRTSGSSTPDVDNILLETNDDLLLETGDKVNME